MKRALIFLFAFTSTVVSTAMAASTASRRPNILILLADDLGYGDVGFTGSKEIKTPNLDRLAAAGAQLDNYYVQPLCSPTRAALLTGRYPMRYGLQVGVLLPWERRGLPTDEFLLPQALKSAGYSTAIVGKWHLGHNAPEYLPLRRGFERQYGLYNGQIDYFAHERLGGFDWHRDDRVCRDEGYSTHLIAKEAVRLIERQDEAKPFFLYVPFNAVHSPFQVPENYKQPYAHLPEPRRSYAGMMAAMDEAVGQICAALDRKGLRSNTLIVFSSDNGGPGPGRISDNGPFRSGKGSVYEGGTHTCAFATWDGRIKPGTRVATPLHVVDWFPTLLGLAGATAQSKAPLDGRDVWPVIAAGETIAAREILINSTPNVGAIRVGDWKYVVRHPGAAAEEQDPEGGASKAKKAKKRAVEKDLVEQVFQLARDPGEKQDLAAEQPEKLRELRAAYERYASQAVKPGNQEKPENFIAPAVWGER